MNARQKRDHIFKLLFRSEFHSVEEMHEQLDMYISEMEHPMLDEGEKLYDLTKEELEALTKKYDAITSKKDEIDMLINSRAEKWTTDRMGKVELTVIRLALYEMSYDDDIPQGVAINEAIEIAKKYSGKEAGAFVNGILAKFTE